jgi:signal transduction histidine kinase
VIPARLRQARGSPAFAQAWDAGLAAVFAVLLVVDLALRHLEPGQQHSTAVAYLLALALNVPYAFHRKAPMAMLAVVLTALLVYSALQFSSYPGLSIFLLLFGITLHADRRRSLVAFVAACLAMTVAIAVQPDGVGTRSTYLSSGLAIAVTWLLADNVRSRRARWRALEERSRRLEAEREERARQAVVDERLRIARELHDVVAHSMTVIAVQSSVGLHMIDADPGEARQALTAISATSRSVLTEMRRLLGVLRQDGEPKGALSPAPGMKDLPWLVDEATNAGIAVNVTVRGEQDDIPAGVDLSAFRIVQEAVTNVLKHGGTTADVTIDFTDTDIGIEVVDRGVDQASGFNRGPHVVTPGHGIIGMRERAGLFGGQFSAGPRPGGGFRVAARLPFEATAP